MLNITYRKLSVFMSFQFPMILQKNYNDILSAVACFIRRETSCIASGRAISLFYLYIKPCHSFSNLSNIQHSLGTQIHTYTIPRHAFYDANVCRMVKHCAI